MMIFKDQFEQFLNENGLEEESIKKVLRFLHLYDYKKRQLMMRIIMANSDLFDDFVLIAIKKDEMSVRPTKQLADEIISIEKNILQKIRENI